MVNPQNAAAHFASILHFEAIPQGVTKHEFQIKSHRFVRARQGRQRRRGGALPPAVPRSRCGRIRLPFGKSMERKGGVFRENRGAAGELRSDFPDLSEHRRVFLHECGHFRFHPESLAGLPHRGYGAADSEHALLGGRDGGGAAGTEDHPHHFRRGSLLGVSSVRAVAPDPVARRQKSSAAAPTPSSPSKPSAPLPDASAQASRSWRAASTGFTPPNR